MFFFGGSTSGVCLFMQNLGVLYLRCLLRMGNGRGFCSVLDVSPD